MSNRRPLESGPSSPGSGKVADGCGRSGSGRMLHVSSMPSPTVMQAEVEALATFVDKVPLQLYVRGQSMKMVGNVLNRVSRVQSSLRNERVPHRSVVMLLLGPS